MTPSELRALAEAHDRRAVLATSATESKAHRRAARSYRLKALLATTTGRGE